MSDDRWTYTGDVNLRHGGAFLLEEDDPKADMVWMVRVIPFSDEGGPDNLFKVEAGDVFLGDAESVRASLEGAGVNPDEATLGDKAHTMLLHCGMEADEEWIVRIGAVDPHWDGRGPNPEPDLVLPANARLRNWVDREFLARERPPKGCSPGR